MYPLITDPDELSDKVQYLEDVVESLQDEVRDLRHSLKSLWQSYNGHRGFENDYRNKINEITKPFRKIKLWKDENSNSQNHSKNQ